MAESSLNERFCTARDCKNVFVVPEIFKHLVSRALFIFDVRSGLGEAIAETLA
jgi:hypothetical protein